MTRYAYDAAGNMTSLTDPDGNVTSWTYDALNRGVSETNPLGTAYYSYDADGDLTQTTDRDGQTTQYVSTISAARRRRIGSIRQTTSSARSVIPTIWTAS